MKTNIQQIVHLAGLAQITLAIASTAVPRVLGWKPELAKVRTLIKQMFWTYAGYIFVINISFGLISVFDYQDLINNSRLSTLITGFIAVYWISRVLIQFFYFDKTDFPTGKWHKLAEVTLVALFIFLSMVYSAVWYINYSNI